MTTRDKWLCFHKANPLVWKSFERLTIQAIHSGKKRVSSTLIMNVIRWDMYIKTDDPNSSFRINNNYFPYYARYFMYKHPEHVGVFVTRMISKSK